MDAYQGWEPIGSTRSIRFTGTWREYLPIAATNALLTVVTLGVYRFWATARQRRYLWSRTEVIDDRLEWTGTGKEMFIGFLLVVAILLPFFLFLQFLFPALLARGHVAAAMGFMALFYIGLIFLGGFARIRALRYRLSRTWWHGIRGGSDNGGWAYGCEYLGRMGLTVLTAFIVFPWAATRLWERRWNSMSFGPFQFQTQLDAKGLKRRWALLYLIPIALVLVVGMLGAAFVGGDGQPSGISVVLIGVVTLLLFYIGIPLATLHWFAKFYRKAAGQMTIGGLEFDFDATTWDWLKLFLGNLALAVVTLGFGLTYWGYRNWSFMVRHLSIQGEVDLSQLTQSVVHAPGEAEGFADMFDVGAI